MKLPLNLQVFKYWPSCIRYTIIFKCLNIDQDVSGIQSELLENSFKFLKRSLWRVVRTVYKDGYIRRVYKRRVTYTKCINSEQKIDIPCKLHGNSYSLNKCTLTKKIHITCIICTGQLVYTKCLLHTLKLNFTRG